MAHNLATTADGRWAYVGKDSAWHTLGEVTGQFMSWADIQAKGIFPMIGKHELLNPLGDPCGVYATFRMDTLQALGAVKSAYEVVQTDTLMSKADVLVGAKNGAHWSTAGMLGQGETVWGLIDLGQTIHVGEDAVNEYLLVNARHDGQGAIVYKKVAERVVCQNTLTVALNQKTTALLRIAHNGGANDRLDKVEQALLSLEAESKTLQEKFNWLAEQSVKSDYLRTYFSQLFPQDEEQKWTNTQIDRMEAVLERFEQFDGQPKHAGTKWALSCAITDAVCWSGAFNKGFRSEKAALTSQTFGDNAKFAEKAVELLYVDVQRDSAPVALRTLDQLNA